MKNELYLLSFYREQVSQLKEFGEYAVKLKKIYTDISDWYIVVDTKLKTF